MGYSARQDMGERRMTHPDCLTLGAITQEIDRAEPRVEIVLEVME